MRLVGFSLAAALVWCLPYLTALFWPTIFIALLPVLYLIYSKNSSSFKYFLLIALIASFTGLFEVRHYSVRVYLFGAAVAALFVLAFLLISDKLTALAGERYVSLLIPATVWTTLVLVFNFQSLLSAIFDMGIAIPHTAPIIWYVGSIGITYLVILWSSSVARYLALKDKASIISAAVVAMALLASVCYSLSADAMKLAPAGKGVRVALVQNNIAKKWNWLQQNPYEVLKANQALTKRAGEADPDIIVWPEYALPIDIVGSHPVIRDAVAGIARDAGAKLVIGSVRMDKASGWHDDVALVIDGNGKIVDSRPSVNPAPFNKFTNRALSSLQPVDGFGTVICWEELDPNVSRRYADNGASFLLALTNNQDLDKTQFKYYTPFYSRARAAENMRYIARVTNTGVTQIIDPLGRVVKSLMPGRPDILVGDVYPIYRKTFYTRNGPAIVWAVNIIVAISLFLPKKRWLK